MAGTGSVEVFNNTLSDCAANNSANANGSRGAFGVGGGPATLTMHLRNNIAYQLPGEIYIDGSTSQITGDKNLWFGAGNGPGQTAGNINADPLFVDLGKFDFHLRDASPARDAGTTVLPNNPFVVKRTARATDKDGVPRPQGKAFDLGAYEAPDGEKSLENCVGRRYSVALPAARRSSPRNFSVCSWSSLVSSANSIP